MNFCEYAWKVSTYRPVELGDVEFEILGYFAYRISTSTYEIFKMLDTVSVATRNKPASYKNTHKRVKRLAQLRLIEEIKGHFERGAKYYNVSTYGLISYAGRVIAESISHIKHNKKDIAIQCLLLQFFEERTIDSIYPLKSFPTREIGDYLHDCFSVTIDICKERWNKIKQYQIEDILPSDEVIQKYMSHLDGKKVDQSVLKEIIEYEKRLLRKYQINENLRLIYHEFRKEPPASSKKGRFPPFPLDDIYDHIVCRLRFELETRIKSLANTLVTRLGEIAISEDIETKAQADYPLAAILTDKKLFELVRPMKENFDKGYTQLLTFSNQ
ncbi:MAG: hypothetical protein WAM14_13305 [Candidatus Nitrosopolaris sp.]